MNWPPILSKAKGAAAPGSGDASGSGADALSYPSLQRSVQQAATDARKSLFNNTSLQLGFLVLAAATGMVSFTIAPAGKEVDVGALLPLVFFILAMVVRLQTLQQQKERSWFDGRASAGKVASIAWRYAVGGAPFELVRPDTDVEAAFVRELRHVLEEVSRNNFVNLDAREVGTDSVTESMRAIRNGDLASRKSTYLSGRLEERAQGFAHRAQENEGRARFWERASAMLEALGILGAVLRLLQWIAVDTLGVAAAGTAAVTAWLQLRQHRRLVKAYGLAVQNVSLLRAELGKVQGEDQWVRFVDSAEDVFMQEYSRWKANHEDRPASSQRTAHSSRPMAHFVAPSRSHSEYYARLHLKMEIDLEKHGYDWRLHAPDDKAGEDAMYDALWPLLEHANPDDAIILVPRGLEQPHLQKRFVMLLDRTRAKRLIFLDQQPPDALRNHPKIAVIGPDNRKVGILAATALYSRLRDEPQAEYIVLQGPGGPSRADGFAEGIDALASKPCIRARIPDKDRFENENAVRLVLKGRLPQHDGIPVGIFAGNDETAIVVERVLDGLKKRQPTPIIASCDRLREMMFLISGGRSRVIATVYTDVERQALAVRWGIGDGAPLLVEPELWPSHEEFERARHDPRVEQIWNGAK